MDKTQEIIKELGRMTADLIDTANEVVAQQHIKEDVEKNPFSDLAKLVKQAEEAGFSRQEAIRFSAIVVANMNSK